LQKLIAESVSQPQTKKVKESADDTKYYVRHALFPQVIRAIYDDACSICGLFVRTGKSSTIESAHIKPFADYHDDHPSNGLALCKDHHWAFDAGGFSITDDYNVLVSSKLQHTPNFITAGAPLKLPSSVNCYPSPASLAYHREKKFQK
jgi:putative restriction endonuclease